MGIDLYPGSIPLAGLLLNLASKSSGAGIKPLASVERHTMLEHYARRCVLKSATMVMLYCGASPRAFCLFPVPWYRGLRIDVPRGG